MQWDSFDLEGHATRFLLSGDIRLDPEREVLLILAPDIGYGDAEAAAIRRFVYEGGALVVAGDRGAGRDLLRAIDVGVRLAGTSLYTPSFEHTPDRVITQSTGLVPGLPTEVILTRPIAVTGGEPILLAPEPTWQDTNDNGRPDLDESVTNPPVASLARFGKGQVVVVGDRLLFHRADQEVQRALLNFISEAGARTLVLDEAHHGEADPFGLAPVLAAAPGTVASTVMLMGAAGVGAFVVLRPRVRRAHAMRRGVSHLDRYDPALVEEVLSELQTR